MVKLLLRFSLDVTGIMKCSLLHWHFLLILFIIFYVLQL